MLGSNDFMLSGKSEVQPATMSERPLDPGGYFVVKGLEKVIFGSGAAEQESNLGRDG